MQTKLKVVVLGLIAVIMCVALLGVVPVTAMAETTTTSTAEEQDAEPYALFVNVSVALDGADGKVWAKAHTKLAIFATSIYVVLELYSSDTYQESYTDMTLEKRMSISHLAQGESIKIEQSTNGVQKYWKARMYYKADSANFKFAETPTTLFDANGIIVL